MQWLEFKHQVGGVSSCAQDLVKHGCCLCALALLLFQAAAQEAVWAKQIATSDHRADHAEGMATAMNVSVKQLEAELQQRQQEVAAKEGKKCRSTDGTLFSTDNVDGACALLIQATSAYFSSTSS